MSIPVFLGLSALTWVFVFVALIVGVVVYLKRKGVFRRAADDAAATLKDGVQSAVEDAADDVAAQARKVGGA